MAAVEVADHLLRILQVVRGHLGGWSLHALGGVSVGPGGGATVVTGTREPPKGPAARGSGRASGREMGKRKPG